jgi:hypothetical protein
MMLGAASGSSADVAILKARIDVLEARIDEFEAGGGGDTVAPTITSPSAFSVNEGTAFNTVATANDSDVTWTKSGTNAGLVTLNANTGAWSVAAQDFETRQVVSFTLTATDAAGNPKPQAVTLTILNLNDTNPAAFSFAAAANVTPGSPQTSGAITISGLGANDSVPVSVSGAVSSLLSKNGGAFVAGPLSAVNGDTFAVRHTASGSNAFSTSTTLSAGATSATFTSTTAAAPSIVQNRIIFEGDSIPASGATGFVGLFAADNPSLDVRNLAVGGSGLISMLARRDAALALNAKAIVIHIGANDLNNGTENPTTTVWLNKLFDYLAPFRAAGTLVIVNAVLPQYLAGAQNAQAIADHNTKAASVNGVLRSAVGTQIDGFVDFERTIMGLPATAANTNYYWDGTHPIDPGHLVLWHEVSRVVKPLMGLAIVVRNFSAPPSIATDGTPSVGEVFAINSGTVTNGGTVGLVRIYRNGVDVGDGSALSGTWAIDAPYFVRSFIAETFVFADSPTITVAPAAAEGAIPQGDLAFATTNADGTAYVVGTNPPRLSAGIHGDIDKDDFRQILYYDRASSGALQVSDSRKLIVENLFDAADNEEVLFSDFGTLPGGSFRAGTLYQRKSNGENGPMSALIATTLDAPAEVPATTIFDSSNKSQYIAQSEGGRQIKGESSLNEAHGAALNASRTDKRVVEFKVTEIQAGGDELTFGIIPVGTVMPAFFFPNNRVAVNRNETQLAVGGVVSLRIYPATAGQANTGSFEAFYNGVSFYSVAHSIVEYVPMAGVRRASAILVNAGQDPIAYPAVISSGDAGTKRYN